MNLERIVMARRFLSPKTTTNSTPKVSAFLEETEQSSYVYNTRYTATTGKNNSLLVGDGQKSLAFNAGILAQGSGINNIQLGEGQHSITIKSGIAANSGGTNRFSSLGGNNDLTITGNVTTSGLNEFAFNYGDHNVVINGDLLSNAGGANRFSMNQNFDGYGSTNFKVTGSIKSSGTTEVHTGSGDDTVNIEQYFQALASGSKNLIETGEGNDTVVINRGMYAANGANNTISTGDGNDTVILRGYPHAAAVTGTGKNYIDLGAGNDKLIITENSDVVGAGIRAGGLTVNGGDGYDTLVLDTFNHVNSAGQQSRSDNTFQASFKPWLTDIAKTSGLGSMNMESIQVGVDRNTDMLRIDWLTKLVNDYNSHASDEKYIDYAMNLDHFASSFKLADVFTKAYTSSFGEISLEGSQSNQLTIGNTLRSGGYTHNDLIIKGDTNDTVKVGSSWTFQDVSHDDRSGVDYNHYTNSIGEDIYVQMGMTVQLV